MQPSHSGANETRRPGLIVKSRLIEFAVWLAAMWVLGLVADPFLPARERGRLVDLDNVVRETVYNWAPWPFAQAFWKNTWSGGFFQYHWRFSEGRANLDRQPGSHEPGTFAVCWGKVAQDIDRGRTLVGARPTSWPPLRRSPLDQQLRPDRCWNFIVSNDSAKKYLALVVGAGDLPDLLRPLVLLNIPFAYPATIANLARESPISAVVGVACVLSGMLPFLSMFSGERESGLLVPLLCLGIAPWIGGLFMFVVAKAMYWSFLLLGEFVLLVQALTGVAMFGWIVHTMVDHWKDRIAESIAESVKA